MDDGRRRQYKKGFIRFKTAPISSEYVTGVFDKDIVPLREYTLDLFEDYQDPDNLVRHRVEELEIENFFATIVLHLN